MTAATVLSFSCGLRDDDAEDSPKAISIQLYAVDALKEAVSIGPVSVTVNGNSYAEESVLSFATNTIIQVAASHNGSAYEEACHYKWRVMSGGGAMLGSNTSSELTFNVGNFPATNNLYVDVTCGAADDNPQTFGPIYIQAGWSITMDFLQNPIFWIIVTAASEIIGMMPQCKSNGVLQLFISGLMSLKPKNLKK